MVLSPDRTTFTHESQTYLNKLPCATPAQSSTPNVLCFRFASPTPFYADTLPDFNTSFQRLFGQTCHLSCQHRQYPVYVSPRRCMSNLVTIGPVVLEKTHFLKLEQSWNHTEKISIGPCARRPAVPWGAAHSPRLALCMRCAAVHEWHKLLTNVPKRGHIWRKHRILAK